jgi:hypothetical protein
MKQFLSVVFAVTLAALLITLASPAGAAGGEKACFESCRAELIRAGTFSSYPRGYCRRKCGYWVGAPADVRR